MTGARRENPSGPQAQAPQAPAKPSSPSYLPSTDSRIWMAAARAAAPVRPSTKGAG
jgi:hypothetical protein